MDDFSPPRGYTVTCRKCKKITDNYYPVQSRKGKYYLCSECYERKIRHLNKPWTIERNGVDQF